MAITQQGRASSSGGVILLCCFILWKLGEALIMLASVACVYDFSESTVYLLYTFKIKELTFYRLNLGVDYFLLNLG